MKGRKLRNAAAWSSIILYPDMKYITKTTQFCHQVKLMHFNINLHLIPIDAGEEETHFGTKRDKNIQYVFTFFFFYTI